MKTAADASAALDRSNSLPAGQDSPSTMLDLFGVRARRPFFYLRGLVASVLVRSARGDGDAAPTPSTRRFPRDSDALAATRAPKSRAMTARDPSQMKGGGALDFDGDALLALDDDDAEDALKTDDGDALDVSFDALDMNMDAYDLGVPSCGGAFTPSTRVVSRRG